MPRVPYTGTPDVAPQDPATPNVGVQAFGAAFGTNVGQAVEGLGDTLRHSGDELFSRAIALQNLQNETDAKDADTQYMMKAGELHANFSTLEGKAAVDAYPDYIKSLQEARQGFRDNLGSDVARKMYDSNSLSTMGRTIFNGAGHAASENKRWALGASNARIGALGDQALLTPNDDLAFQRSVNSVKAEVQQQGSLQGWSPEQIDQETAKQTSTLVAKRITGLLKTQPFAAKKLLDDAVKNGNLRGELVPKVTDAVNQGLYTVGARNISHTMNSGTDLYWGSKPVDIGQAKEAIGQYETGGNYDALGVQTAHGRALGKYQVMEEFLPGFLKQAGMAPMSAQEFVKNHAAQDQLFSTIFGGYMKQYGSFNEAASRWFTGRGVDDARAHAPPDALGTTVNRYLTDTNAILARNMPLADKVERGRSMAQEIAPDAPLMQDYTQQRIEADYNQAHRIKLDDQYTNKQTVETALIGGFGDGKLPTTIEELKAADPKVETAWANLEPSQQRKYLNVLAQNAKGDQAWTDDSLRRYQALKGMAASDPADFLDMDVIAEKVPNSAKRELINLQGRLKQNAEGDPRVTKALGILQADLFNAGVSKAQDKDRYYQFTGALQGALEDFQEENKRPPKAKEVQEIGSRLLQQQATPWMLNPWSKTSTFEVPVPDKEAEEIKADPMWGKIGVEPTPQQVQRIYVRQLYQKLYGVSVKSAKTPTPGAPQVPMSK